ncbi:molybdopterin molybdotransferase MoeA [Nesterenkonia alba]|uniref:molybdopterin molybdotransferase MoeA n=1 Tax=Nesterenkonia alba TaxID=515814 RepID=UPI0004182B2E|nr:molybdopterin molybdotransferase MoeA [Nesterenkonia alba]
MIALHRARRIAAEAPALPAQTLPLTEAIGARTAAAVTALLDIPHAATSAMDGWAIAEAAGSASWRVVDHHPEGPADLAPALQRGEAAAVVTGSPIPEGAVSVLRTEHSQLDGDRLTPSAQTPDLEPGRNIRPAGVEARRGERILPAGMTLTPARAATAAVAGYDTVQVIPLPRVRIVLTGGEVITSGLPAAGEVRDVFGVALPGMLASLGVKDVDAARIDDDVETLVPLLRKPGADVVITTGGTAHSRADTLRPALARVGAEILIDSVDMRPGHPTVLARLGSTWVLGLPGNPLAGFAGLAVVGQPLLAALQGVTPQQAVTTLEYPSGAQLPGARRGTRVLPAIRRHGGVHPAAHRAAHMMRGLAGADVLALVPTGGLEPGEPVQCLPVPGTTAGTAERSQPWDG